MEEMTNELKDKLESTLITRSFNISGMPLKDWEHINSFCKENFGDSRWNMIVTLVNNAEEDWKYNLLYEEIQDMKVKIAEMSGNVKPEEVKKKIKTFGSG
jgi:hypothetical protein